MKLFISACVTAFLLAGCGGGGGDGGNNAGGSKSGGNAQIMGQKVVGMDKYNQKPADKPEAARFLHQATLGVTDADIDAVMNKGYGPWLEEQMNASLTPSISAKSWLYEWNRQAGNPIYASSVNYNIATEFKQIIEGKDLLRQRVSFALSQIFVISRINSLRLESEGTLDYSDMLSANAFGNYRDLLEKVTLHPMMGVYLSMLRNQKENPATGREPDQNYAREIMQLFSIGLNELNIDGTEKKNGNAPIPTYTSADVTGLAKALTGWSWNCTTNSCGTVSYFFYPPWPNPQDSKFSPMRAYPAHHSTSEKKFLATTIPASTTPDPTGDLKIALDTIANHPNVAPFISKQLIQRLVKSNPSKEYVKFVAEVFNDNGNGERGNLGSVIAAILLHDEARILPTDNYSGKLREPFIRYTNWLRSLEVKSDLPNKAAGYIFGNYNLNLATQLAQAPYKSPSVFNFYRPGYVAPQTKTSLSQSAKIQPELQITDEVTTASYLNFIYNKINSNGGSGIPTYAKEIPLTDNPKELVARLNLLLAANQISSTTAAEIEAAVASMPIPSGDATQITNARKRRIKIASFLIMASPEYIVQR